MEQTIVIRDELIGNLSIVKEKIRQLKTSCCTDSRYCMFDDLATFVTEVEEDTKSGSPHPILGDAQKKMIRTGEVLGKLAISCCVPERISSYSECVTLLNKILYRSFELALQSEAH